MDCELCGRRASAKAKIEGTVVAVCEDCSRFGPKIYEAKPVEIKDRPKSRAPEEIYFVPDFSNVIKQKRESLSLTRDQLAEKIGVKANIIERIERGSRPEKPVAEKLEHFLGIRIISSLESEKSTYASKNAEPLTLGDVVTLRKRKK